MPPTKPPRSIRTASAACLLISAPRPRSLFRQTAPLADLSRRFNPERAVTDRNATARLGQTGAEASNLLLRSLSTSDYIELQKHLQPVSYPAGHVLFQPEGKVQDVYFPEEGLVSLISIMRSGHEVESAVVGREGAVITGFQNGWRGGYWSVRTEPDLIISR